MSVTVSKQAARTRGWIFGALLRLLGQKPYNEIKIANIAEEAGVSRQSFYRNFKDKDDIVGKYAELIFGRCFEAARAETESQEGVRGRALDRFFELIYRDRADLLKLKEAGLSHLIYYALRRCAADQSGMEERSMGDSYERCLAEYQLGGLLGATVAWINRNMDVPPRKMGAYIRNMLLPAHGNTVCLPFFEKVKGKEGMMS